ncbi:MAG: hypothetical protein ABIF17_01595 [Patescibacteria group bacterium]
MYSNYTQTWKKTNLEKEILNKAQATSSNFVKLAFEIILSIMIVIISAFILNWVDKRISYQPPIEYKDVPAYTEHVDQRFIQDFLKAGYINKNINLSLL